MSIAYRYIGDGAYLMGVPARDLNTDEAKQFQETLLSPAGRLLYESVAKGKKAKATKANDSESSESEA